MFDRKIFAERFRSLRIASGKTQADIALLLNVTRTQVSDIENGKTTTSVERLWLAADYFGVSIDYLVGRTNVISFQQPDAKPRNSDGNDDTRVL